MIGVEKDGRCVVLGGTANIDRLWRLWQQEVDSPDSRFSKIRLETESGRNLEWHEVFDYLNPGKLYAEVSCWDKRFPRMFRMAILFGSMAYVLEVQAGHGLTWHLVLAAAILGAVGREVLLALIYFLATRDV